MRMPRRQTSGQQIMLRTPEMSQQSTPEMSQHHHTPEQTPQNTPCQTPDPGTPGESSSAVINGVWKVGTMHDDGRIRVEVIEGVLEPSNKCSKQTSSIMFERLEPKGFTWKLVSNDTKLFYFEEFKKYFIWRQSDDLVYQAWLQSASHRYKDLRSRARAKWEKKNQLDNRIGKNVWLSWIEEWKTPECMAKTEIKRNNRKGGADVNEYPATHTGGSSSARKTAALLADDYTRDPFSPELFLYTHTKNHDMKTFIDEKSAKIYEKIKALRDERSRPIDGSSTPQPVDENQLYYDAVGGRNSRNKIYGIGSSQNLFYAPSSSTIAHISNSPYPNSQDYEKLQTELEVMKERMKEMDAMQQRMKDMENLLARMSDNHQNQ
ncbi:hypothetical protein POM88_002522 [Heracleum sosnowskyi]|uniref:Uncharacterized protein n=1 Tax=Heracleum sosnowskyi TaxID=360622 RepID=A0AAD8NBD5_9APIA|nr:hypothetical protein POM88_002522 [Heracleum sosnowskyi]